MRSRLLLTTALLTLPLFGIVAMRQPAVRVSHATRLSSAPALPDLGPAPAIRGGTAWLNSAALTSADLRGKVALVEIWTYRCYNCLNALPHIKQTAARFRQRGLVTIGVHTPETDSEKDPTAVAQRVKALGIDFPVVLDNDFAIWNSFNNRYWPSVYLIDRKGRIRFHHDGEGKYAEIDDAVQALLAEQP